jgi:hypothetical protein
MSARKAKVLDTRLQLPPSTSTTCPLMLNCRRVLSYNGQYTRIWATVSVIAHDAQGLVVRPADGNHV